MHVCICIYILQLDTNCTGKVQLQKFLDMVVEVGNEGLARLASHFLREREQIKMNDRVCLESDITFSAFVHLSYRKSHYRELKRINSWVKPTKLLTDAQQRDLYELFSEYEVSE
jgi:hypothetical protein